MVISKSEISKMCEIVWLLQFSNTIDELRVSFRVSFIVQYLKKGSGIPALSLLSCFFNCFPRECREIHCKLETIIVNLQFTSEFTNFFH